MFATIMTCRRPGGVNYLPETRDSLTRAINLEAAASERPADWMYHGMTCAHRAFGAARGVCDCGLVVKEA